MTPTCPRALAAPPAGSPRVIGYSGPCAAELMLGRTRTRALAAGQPGDDLEPPAPIIVDRELGTVYSADSHLMSPAPVRRLEEDYEILMDASGEIYAEPILPAPELHRRP